MHTSSVHVSPKAAPDSVLPERVASGNVRQRERFGNHGPIPALQIARTDLEFRFEADGMVDIAVRITNPGPGMSPPRRGRIEQAAFGAFLPWQALTAFKVPALRAGESTLVEMRVPRVALGGEPPVGPPDSNPTALRGNEPARDFHEGLQVMFRHFAMRLGVDDLCADGARLEFAGNLDVHIGDTSVERHLSGPLHLSPGRFNFADFAVGSGTDAYRFELRGDAAPWDAVLRRRDREGWKREIVPCEWYDGRVVRRVTLAVRPPALCQHGAVDVHVEQRSSGHIAVVEFDLNAHA